MPPPSFIMEIVEMNKDIIIKMSKFFINKCKKARKTSGKSIKNVADDLGYSYQNIQKFEKGDNNSLIIAYYYMKTFKVEV